MLLLKYYSNWPTGLRGDVFMVANQKQLSSMAAIFCPIEFLKNLALILFHLAKWFFNESA